MTFSETANLPLLRTSAARLSAKGPMTSRKPRTIRVGPLVYFWRVHHRHRPAAPGTTHDCAEVFAAFLEGFPRRPARILFPETGEHGPGFPGQRGVVVDYREPTRHINLNRPRIARLLIELALVSGWVPDRSRGELVIPNGYHLLREHRAQLLAALDDGGGSGAAQAPHSETREHSEGATPPLTCVSSSRDL